MELVEGPNLERLIETRTLDASRALSALGEVLEGLSAMHEEGVGHLDLKPANVVLRGGETAVLVDFGLAGRNIRLGCGSAPYAPPEVWGAAPSEARATPMAADVYQFACLAFEVLTGQLLMEGMNEVELVSAHVSHDGVPPRLRALTEDPRLVGLGETLFAALRRLPQNRIGVADLRAEWRRRTANLEKLPWPLRFDRSA
jgi:serine/threonine protein kinase